MQRLFLSWMRFLDYYSAIKLEATMLQALAKRRMSNICIVNLHASMTFSIHIFAAWLNSKKNSLRYQEKNVDKLAKIV